MAKAKTKRHASALKANRKALIRKEFNFQVRNRVRTLTAKVIKEIQSKNIEKAKANFKLAQSAWSKAAKTGIFSKNTAARKIGQLASRIAALATK